MNDKMKNIADNGAEKAAGATEAITGEIITNPVTKPQEEENTGVYTHKFRKPFEYEGVTYTDLTFQFDRLRGEDMLAVEKEMQGSSDFALTPEISLNFQSKIAARASGIGSDVIEAMPMKDFNAITGAARRFLLDSGY